MLNHMQSSKNLTLPVHNTSTPPLMPLLGQAPHTQALQVGCSCTLQGSANTESYYKVTACKDIGESVPEIFKAVHTG